MSEVLGEVTPDPLLPKPKEPFALWKFSMGLIGLAACVYLYAGIKTSVAAGGANAAYVWGYVIARAAISIVFALAFG
jgi:hypothetical protein